VGQEGNDGLPGLVLTPRGRRVAAVVVAAIVALVSALTLDAPWRGDAPPDGDAMPRMTTGGTTGAGSDPLPDLSAAPSGEPSVTAGAPSPMIAGEGTPPVVVNGRTQPPMVAVPPSASGQPAVVAGSTAAVTGPTVWTYRVEVEDGLAFDGTEFAAAVHATLSDPRGWATDGHVFQRVDTDGADFRVILASPALTDQLCAPLQTRGQVSCRNGEMVVLNALRWATGVEDYGADLASYREYLVNHEVGHRLGRNHVDCPGPGQPAPIMMQQTYGVGDCTPNPWPLPGE